MSIDSASKGISRATIKDVAKHASVSVATVSRVINKNGQVAKETSDRVWIAISELKYTPHAAAKGLRSHRTQTVGFLVPEISAPFQFPLLRGIEMIARKSGYSLLIHATQDIPLLSQPLRPIGEHNTDGLLVLVGSLTEEEILYFYRLQFPIVLICQSAPQSLDIPTVLFENKSGAKKIVDHLIEVHGYRRIAFLRGPVKMEDSYWREQGYYESLKAHQIPIDLNLIGMGEFDEEAARITVKNWMKGKIEFDAIFAGDDESAIGAILAIHDMGKRVPQDIAVVGFDDVYLTHARIPPLTTVRNPIVEMGQKAMQQLVQLIQTGIADMKTLLPTELIIRHSCGCTDNTSE
jgi:DNA-binding LacI/PurR family transcriptional regulator